MVTNNAELGRINQSALDGELSRWIEQDKLAVQGHPKETEYQKISEQAKSILGRMSLSLAMPGGLVGIEQGAEQLKEMYERAVTLRAEIAQDSIRQSFGVAPGQDLQTVLESDIEKATASLGTGFQNAVSADLKNLSQAFSVNPADALQGRVSGNKFFLNLAGKTAVDFDQVDNARKSLDQLREAGRTNPALASLADKFETGLRQVEATDPMRGAHHKWYNEHMVGPKMDTKPLRIFGAVLGGLVTTLGIGQTLFSKEHSLSPATVGWAAATMFFVNPNFLRSNGTRALETITALGSPAVNDIVTAGFKGPQGRAAFEELQEIRKSNPTALRALQKSDQPLNMAQIGTLTDSAASPLLKILAKMPEDKRGVVLRQFGQSITDDEKEFIGQMLEARV